MQCISYQSHPMTILVPKPKEVGILVQVILENTLGKQFIAMK
jgi:hypothetical protein